MFSQWAKDREGRLVNGTVLTLTNPRARSYQTEDYKPAAVSALDRQKTRAERVNNVLGLTGPADEKDAHGKGEFQVILLRKADRVCVEFNTIQQTGFALNPFTNGVSYTVFSKKIDRIWGLGLQLKHT